MLADYVDSEALKEGMIRLSPVRIDTGPCGLCFELGRRYNGICWECLSPSVPILEKESR